MRFDSFRFICSGFLLFIFLISSTSSEAAWLKRKGSAPSPEKAAALDSLRHMSDSPAKGRLADEAVRRQALRRVQGFRNGQTRPKPFKSTVAKSTQSSNAPRKGSLDDTRDPTLSDHVAEAAGNSRLPPTAWVAEHLQVATPFQTQPLPKFRARQRRRSSGGNSAPATSGRVVADDAGSVASGSLSLPLRMDNGPVTRETLEAEIDRTLAKRVKKKLAAERAAAEVASVIAAADAAAGGSVPALARKAHKRGSKKKMTSRKQPAAVAPGLSPVPENGVSSFARTAETASVGAASPKGMTPPPPPFPVPGSPKTAAAAPQWPASVAPPPAPKKQWPSVRSGGSVASGEPLDFDTAASVAAASAVSPRSANPMSIVAKPTAGRVPGRKLGGDELPPGFKGRFNTSNGGSTRYQGRVSQAPFRYRGEMHAGHKFSRDTNGRHNTDMGTFHRPPVYGETTDGGLREVRFGLGPYAKYQPTEGRVSPRGLTSGLAERLNGGSA